MPASEPDRFRRFFYGCIRSVPSHSGHSLA